MGRIRTIKPELFEHENLYDAERASGLPLRLAFIGLLCQCDREGRFRWRARTLKSNVLPFDEIDFGAVLDALANYGFVVRYAVNGETFGYVPTFARHQVINSHEAQSAIPAPTDDESQACMCMHVHARGERKGKEYGKEQGKERKKSTARGTRAGSAPRFDAGAHLHSLGVAEKVADDWLAVREGKHAKPTETAIAGIEREAVKAGIALTDALRICCERGWASFRAAWIGRDQYDVHGPPASVARDQRDRAMVTALTGRDPWQTPPDVFDLAPEDVRHVPDRRH